MMRIPQPRFAPFYACVLLVFLFALWLPAAQEGNGSKASPATGQTAAVKPRNARYTITYPDSTKSWKVGTGVAASGKISQTVADTLVRKLSQKGFIRVRPLDVQCCTMQLELLNVFPSEGAYSKSGLTLVARITLLDVDKQNVYSKEYRGQSTSSRNEVSSAAADMAAKVIGDTDLLKALAGS